MGYPSRLVRTYNHAGAATGPTTLSKVGGGDATPAVSGEAWGVAALVILNASAARVEISTPTLTWRFDDSIVMRAPDGQYFMVGGEGEALRFETFAAVETTVMALCEIVPSSVRN